MAKYLSAIVIALMAHVAEAGPELRLWGQVEDRCNLGDSFNEGYCLGRVTGIIEGIVTGAAVVAWIEGNSSPDISSEYLKFCLPNGDPERTILGVISVLRANPKQRENLATLAVSDALQFLYPCGQ